MYHAREDIQWSELKRKSMRQLIPNDGTAEISAKPNNHSNNHTLTSNHPLNHPLKQRSVTANLPQRSLQYQATAVQVDVQRLMEARDDDI